MGLIGSVLRRETGEPNWNAKLHCNQFHANNIWKDMHSSLLSCVNYKGKEDPSNFVGNPSRWKNSKTQ